MNITTATTTFSILRLRVNMERMLYTDVTLIQYAEYRTRLERINITDPGRALRVRLQMQMDGVFD